MQTGAAINKAAERKRATRQTRANQDNMTPTRPSKFSVDMVFGELVKTLYRTVQGNALLKTLVNVLLPGQAVGRKVGQADVRRATPQMIRDYLEERKQVSATAANKDLRYLKALFSFGFIRDTSSTTPPKV